MKFQIRNFLKIYTAKIALMWKSHMKKHQKNFRGIEAEDYM